MCDDDFYELGCEGCVEEEEGGVGEEEGGGEGGGELGLGREGREGALRRRVQLDGRSEEYYLRVL